MRQTVWRSAFRRPPLNADSRSPGPSSGWECCYRSHVACGRTASTSDTARQIAKLLGHRRGSGTDAASRVPMNSRQLKEVESFLLPRPVKVIFPVIFGWNVYDVCRESTCGSVNRILDFCVPNAFLPA